MHAAEFVYIRRISCYTAYLIRHNVASYTSQRGGWCGCAFSILQKKKTRVKKKLAGKQQGFSIFVGVGVWVEEKKTEVPGI